MQGPIDLHATHGRSFTNLHALALVFFIVPFIHCHWQLISSVDLHALFLSDYVGVCLNLWGILRTI